MKKNKQWGTVQNNEKKELKAETNRLILFEEPITKKQCDIGIRIKGTEQITLKQIDPCTSKRQKKCPTERVNALLSHLWN